MAANSATKPEGGQAEAAVTLSTDSSGDPVLPASHEEATVNEEADEQDPVPDPAEQVLKDLVILPPRQKQQTEASSDGLLLPPLRANEPVQSLRAALTEVCGYAHLTSFRFELELPRTDPAATAGASSSSGTGSPAVVTSNNNNNTSDNTAVQQQLVASGRYTGKDAVIAVPAQVKTASAAGGAAAVVLDEYGDLTPLVTKGLTNGSGFRIVLERYDNAGVKDHITRLRSLLEGNGPTVTTLVEEREGANEEENVKQDNGGDGAVVQKTPVAELKVYGADNVAVDGTNLEDFFYLACGEDPSDFQKDTKSLKKKKKGKNGKVDAVTDDDSGFDENQLIRDKVPRWNELEELSRVDCTIRYSGFHPPPPQRRWLGDLAYIVVKLPGEQEQVLQVTATTMGFYINRTTRSTFDPSPAAQAHFSHALLDCLLSASASFKDAWTVSLAALKERAHVSGALNLSPYSSFFRVATRGDFGGFKTAATAVLSSSQALDASLLTPSWLAPLPRMYYTGGGAWNHNQFHLFSPHRADEDLQNTFGVDLRNGAIRDWNEELQIAREMPTNSLTERLERARLIYKVLTEFGEASLLGVKAISEGQITPMNPNEPTRSQVYLHNNIFFSRGVDAGPETFKIAKGDRAARKSSNRDVQCIGTFHRMEKSGLYTLATVLIDYLGTRFVCQSILPGILVGDRSHTLLYGSVETGIPLKWDEELHKLLEDKVGEGMMVATRPVLANPLTDERMEEIKKLKAATPPPTFMMKDAEEGSDADPNASIMTCVPVEAKGILGSDKRKYVLDFGRLTPRDANWVPACRGGSNKLEEAAQSQNGKSNHKIPATLEDDEWTMCVLRPELVSRFTQVRMTQHKQAKKKEKDSQDAVDVANADKNAATADKDDTIANKPEAEEITNGENETEKTFPEPPQLSEEDKQILNSLKLNINVFLPHLRSFEGIDEEAAVLIKADEQLVREVSMFLWDEVLPTITRAIKDGSVHQLPVDGKTLTEFLHRNGVNCRYLGRLATLAKEQEAKDAKTEAALKKGEATVVERKTMPKCWLELIECEMVARAAKHVLDDYLTENGGVAASQPAQTIASFLSALVSETEESAAQTEMRMDKRSSLLPDEDEFGALTISKVGGNGDAVPAPTRSRYDVWEDIEEEIGRRFRYSLSLFNNGSKPNRAIYIPLLRRVCQRTGVRLLSKNYAVGGKCYCGGNNTGGLTASFPISPLDISDIVPLMKHSAAYSEGFIPCTLGSPIGVPPLQVSLQDARATLERAHIQAGGRALGKGLELAQEAAGLYQRVTENAAHPGVIESLELMSTIFLEAGDPANAAANSAKALGLAIQSSSFDSAVVFNAHMSLFQMLFAAHEMDRAVKHLRSAMYLLEILCGPRHTEHYAAYHKLGSAYSHAVFNGKYLEVTLECYKEAKNRDSCDRLMDGFMAKNFAKVLEGLENYKEALEYEKKAYLTLSTFLGKDHQVTKDCDASLTKLTKLAVDKGNRMEARNKMRDDAALADSIAADLAAEEDKKKKKNIKKKKRGKK